MSLTFTKIWDYPTEPGIISVAVLGDRAVITEGQASPPLVWGGCLTTDASDWMYPKNVLVSQDGVKHYDVSQYVLDTDVDAAANIGGIRSNGYVAICCDVPKVEKFYIEMGTPNEGLIAEQRQFQMLSNIGASGSFTKEDFKGNLDRWVQDADDTGHFEGTSRQLSGSAVDKGDGTVGLPATAHGLTAGIKISVEGTTNYNGTHTITSATENEIVITDTYVAEAFTALSKARPRWTLGAGNHEPDIEAGLTVTIGGTDAVIRSITGDGTADGAVQLFSEVPTGTVSSVFAIFRTAETGTIDMSWGAPPSGLTFDGEALPLYGGISYENQSRRFLLLPGRLSLDGEFIRVTFAAATEDPNPVYYGVTG